MKTLLVFELGFLISLGTGLAKKLPPSASHSGCCRARTDVLSVEQVKAREEFGLGLQWMCPRRSDGCAQLTVMLGTNLRMMFSKCKC